MFKTDLEAFLYEPKTVNFLSVAVSVTTEEYKRLSDFEKFSLVCDHSNTIIGSSLIRCFIDLLCVLTNEDIKLHSLKSKIEQNRVWRVVHGGYPASSSFCISESDHCVDYCRFYDDIKSVEIIKHIADKEYDLFQSIEELIEKTEISSADSFLIDVNSFEYSRPDDYHACEIYKKIRHGEKYKKEELGLLISHIICSAGKSKKRDLRIMVSDDISDVWSLCELFEKRCSDIEISICVDLTSCEIFEQIFDIMLKKGKKISLEIIIPKDADNNCIHKSMTLLLETVPFSRIKWKKDYSTYIDKCRI